MTHKHYSATLYKRAKTGKIVYWKIWVESSDRTDAAIIFKETGQLGTKSPTIHKDLISYGKNIGRSNETTPLEQATFQAQSDYKRKQDDGYKSVTDLGIIVHGDYVSYAGQDLSLFEMLEARLPESNTDANDQPKCMLAIDWNKVKTIPYPVIVQPKLDGVRCLLIIKDGTITFLSRTGKLYTTMTHIEEVIKNHPAFLDADVILDGELYAHTDVMSFQDAISAIKKKKKESTKLIKFRMYDIVSEDSQVDRLVHASSIAEEFNNELISYVGDQWAHSKEQVVAFHDSFIEQGYEGAIIRFMDGSYGKGQRSRELLKVKIFNDDEFVFSHFVLGRRGIQDLLAVCHTEDGGEFKPTMVGTIAQKEEMYNSYGSSINKGDLLTVKYFGFTDAGIPRHPNGKAFRENGG